MYNVISFREENAMKSFIKLIPIAVALLTASCKVNASFANTAEVESITLNCVETTLEVNDKLQLKATVLPKNAKDKKVIWTVTTGRNYATISDKGLVTAKAAGTAKITVKSNSDYKIKTTCTINIVNKIVPVTGISLEADKNTVEMTRSLTINANITPSNASNKAINWTSSNTSVATVADGVVKGVALGNATITATTVDGGYQDTFDVTVTEKTSNDDAWTVMIYVCGSNLESDGGAATTDISEVLSINGQPEDVNILYETGGTTRWYNNNVNSDKSLDKTKLQRWEVRNNQLKWKQDLDLANMAEPDTLESFIKWGVKYYPAEKYALILWNHGGAMQGVCTDDNYSSGWSYDYLMNSEVKQALTHVFSDNTLNISSKFEFIGYDACAMQVQDIAEFNSQFFNYMVASEELENGDGWDYTCWIDDLYAGRSTPTILDALCEGFVSQYGSRGNDQTLSWLDLSAMSTYKTAWENMSSTLYNNIGTYGASNFRSWLINNVKYYGTIDDDQGYEDIGTFDVKDFLNEIEKNSTLYSGLSTLVDNVSAAFSNLVKKSSKGGSAGDSYGLCFYFDSGRYCYPRSVYSTSETNFTQWRKIVTKYGYNA